MWKDQKKRKVMKRRAENAVQIVAFFISLLFIGGVVLHLSGGSASSTPDGRPDTKVFSVTPPKVIGPKPSMVIAARAQSEAPDSDAKGKSGAQEQSMPSGGWSAAAEAAAKASASQVS